MQKITLYVFGLSFGSYVVDGYTEGEEVGDCESQWQLYRGLLPAESAFFDLKWRESFLKLKSFTTPLRTASKNNNTTRMNTNMHTLARPKHSYGFESEPQRALASFISQDYSHLTKCNYGITQLIYYS